jgi:hypothetical protein
MSMTLVCQARDYEEVTYEDLIDQISSHKKALENKSRGTNPFDEVKIHGDFGYVNSFSDIDLGSRKVQRYQNGIQISIGVDLFSENWFGETSYRNFGLSNNGTEELILKEIDLKFGYKSTWKGPWSYKIQGGLANRYLTLNDPGKSIHIDDNSPMIMGAAGLRLHMNKVISLGFDLSARSALLSNTADRSSIDFTVGLGATL